MTQAGNTDRKDDSSYNMEIGDVAEGNQIAQGDENQIIGDEAVNIGGDNSGNVVIGDHNTINDSHDKPVYINDSIGVIAKGEGNTQNISINSATDTDKTKSTQSEDQFEALSVHDARFRFWLWLRRLLNKI